MITSAASDQNAWKVSDFSTGSKDIAIISTELFTDVIIELIQKEDCNFSTGAQQQNALMHTNNIEAASVLHRNKDALQCGLWLYVTKASMQYVQMSDAKELRIK